MSTCYRDGVEPRTRCVTPVRSSFSRIVRNNRPMPLVLTDVSDRVATLTLNNPDERNTLTAPMVEEIVAAMDAFEADEGVGAVVVTGTPPAFCAGANLGNLAEATGDGLKNIYEGFLRIARSPLPTLAAVNGAAVGAGMNLALGCDVRIVSDRAKLDTRFLQLGIHPGGGHTWMFRRIAGPQTAMAAVVFGQVLDGAEAERVGLAYKSVPGDDLLDVRPRVRCNRCIGAARSCRSRRSRPSLRWPTSARTTKLSTANSHRSCGVPNSRGLPSGSPRSRSGFRSAEPARTAGSSRVPQSRRTVTWIPRKCPG